MWPKEAKVAKNSQAQQKDAKKYPKAARQPKVANSNKKLPKILTKYPKVARQPKVANSNQKQPIIHKNTQKQPKAESS